MAVIGGPASQKDGEPLFPEQSRPKSERPRSLLDDLWDLQVSSGIASPTGRDPENDLTFAERAGLEQAIEDQVDAYVSLGERRLVGDTPEQFEARAAIRSEAGRMAEKLRRQALNIGPTELKRARRQTDRQAAEGDEQAATLRHAETSANRLADLLWSDFRSTHGAGLAGIDSASIEQAARLVAERDHYDVLELADPEIRKAYLEDVADEVRSRGQSRGGPGIADLLNSRNRSDGFI